MLRIRVVYPRSLFLPIPDPEISDLGSRTPDLGSRIPDPKTATKERGEKKLLVSPFFVAINFTKLYFILFLKCWRKKIWPNFQRIKELFTQKIVQKKPIPDPGSRSRGQKGTGSRISDPRSATLGKTRLHNQTNKKASIFSLKFAMKLVSYGIGWLIKEKLKSIKCIYIPSPSLIRPDVWKTQCFGSNWFPSGSGSGSREKMRILVRLCLAVQKVGFWHEKYTFSR